MISLSSVSALDSNGTNIGSGDDVIGVSDVNSESDFIGDVESDDELMLVSDSGKLNEENDNNGTFTELNELINSGKSNVIELKKNYTYNASCDENYINGISINKNITIEGNGNTISGESTARIFNITKSNVKINNITLTNGKAKNGGAIYNYYNSNLTITNTNLQNNNATNNGGAIYNTNSNLVIQNTTIQNNNATSLGGAIYNTNSNLVIQNTNIGDNRAKHGGAIYNYYNSNLIIKNTTLQNNTAIQNGGAIYNDKSNLTIQNTTLQNNNATSKGGVIYNYNSNLIIKNTTLQNNTAQYGGAIHNNKNSNITLANSTFKNNDANLGNAIFNNGTLELTNNTINTEKADIYNIKTINSTSYTLLLENGIKKVYLNETVFIQAKIIDDNDNLIYGSSISFIGISKEYGTLDLNTTYNNETSMYESNYTLTEKETVMISPYNNNITNNTLTITYIKTLNYIITTENISYGDIEKIRFNIIDNTTNEGVDLVLNVTVYNKKYNVGISEGIGYLEIANLNAGSYTVTTTLKNSDYETFTDISQFEVRKANNTEIIIYSQNTNGTLTTNVILPEDATGNITYVITDKNNTIIANKTAELTNGTANISADDLANGNYTVTVSYFGDNNYKSTTSNSTVEIINSVKQAKLSISCDNITYGHNATIKINLADSDDNPLSGELVVSLNSINYNVAVTNGSGSLTVSNISGGLHKVVANFTSEEYGENIAIANMSVEKLNTTLIFKNMTTNVVLSGARTGEYFNVTLTDINGKALANKTIYIGFNGKVYKRTTNSTGEVQLQINIGYQSANTFSITFLGDENYSGNVSCAIIVVNTLKTTLKVAKTTYTYKSSAKTKTVKATLKLTNGTVLSRQTISIKINGAIYQAKTNSNGVATIKIPITKKGTYTATVTFAGNNQYTKSTASTKVKIS